MIKSNLAIGPMSSEIIESVFRYSQNHNKELMLIASKNQIDYNGGYVNNWTTRAYMKFIKSIRKQYPKSKVIICRDHCGPNFNGRGDLKDTYDTIREDISCGFDLIHIDLCRFNGDKKEKLEETKAAVEYCLRLNPNIMLEIGTDENVGETSNLKDIGKDVDFFKGFCNPEFYVVQTGSLVKEMNQVGNFNKPFVEKVYKMLKSKGLKLKEHNADYLSKEEIILRKSVVDAMNIAPQLGVVQTALIIKKCLIYGIGFDEFIEEAYTSGKWKKWLYKNSEANKLLCSMIAGHYNFTSESYKKIIKQLEEREDIHETIINEIMEVIGHYEWE